MNYTILTPSVRGATSATETTSATQTSRNVRTGRYRTYLLFGAPGSGKGTQGKALGQVPRFFYCACGDVFRSLDTRTKVGQAFIYYSSRGELVPDEISIELWKESISGHVETHRFKPELDALLLDGIPRNLKQADLMESRIDVVKVFHLSCPDRSMLVERLKKRALKDNRLDDANEAVIRKRLETYEIETKPVLDYYESSALIHKIDATQSPARVLWEILGAINGQSQKVA
ncbi:MAG: nucleoside monophosphate kinase [Verrucomicrobia bacterium]|jgi:adenylate kinase|nr:nucleoside monophosphate kinase [Verrucomicrobiota bacterium]